MPASSQTGRPRSNKPPASSSSQQQSSGHRTIRDFFKPYTIPKDRIPSQDVEEDEIVVASPPPKAPVSRSIQTSASPLPSPIRSSQLSVGRTKASATSDTRRDATPSPTRRRGIAQLDGAGSDDEELRHGNPSGSQQRVMSAVEIPTAFKRPLPQAANSGSANMNVSFNSISSLTSLPISSQASSSRRIVEHGVPVVTNSDSGSWEESEDELEDVVLPRKRLRMTPPGDNKAASAAKERTIKPPARHSDRPSTVRKSQALTRSQTPRRRFSPSPPRAAANASSLLKLVREKEKREQAEAEIRETEAAFETEQKLREKKRRKEQDLGGGLKALVADDSDEGERMMLAVERTEAMGDREEEWHYILGDFDDVASKEPTAKDIAAHAPWATSAFAKLKAIVVDAGQREQAALSGFLAEIAEHFGLPPELMDWMFSRLTKEPRDELCEAYVEVFRRHLRREDRVPHRDQWSRVSCAYMTADISCGERKTPMRLVGSTISDGLPHGLRHIVRVVQYACSTAGDKAVSYRSILELALAVTDTRIGRDLQLKGQVQESIATILECVPLHSLDAIAYTISIEIVALPLSLRCRLVSALPCHSKRSHKLRRLLALYLVADKTVPAVAEAATAYFDPAASHWPKVLLSRLRSSQEWSISESTNYANLNALIPTLDIALDAGFTPTVKYDMPIKAASTSAFPGQQPALSAEERAFNEQIDVFTDTLRALGARIRDAGTSHLRRTEAKSALEKVIVRLEWCVRTRPRPRKGVFGGGQEGEKGSMSAFLTRQEVDGVFVRGSEGGKESKKHSEDRVGVIGEDRLSDRDAGSDVEGGADEGHEVGLDEF